MVKNEKLAEKVEQAITKSLWNGTEYRRYKSSPSCVAVWDVVLSSSIADEQRDFNNFNRICYLTGLPPGGTDFKEFDWGPERQQARALWLTFVAHWLREGVDL